MDKDTLKAIEIIRGLLKPLWNTSLLWSREAMEEFDELDKIISDNKEVNNED